MQYSETRTTSWSEALKHIRSLGGLKRFKSSLFFQAFGNKHYGCEFLILGHKGKLQGAMTYSFEEWDETYKVGPIWHIGDFDTAKGTSGVAHELLQRFINRHGSTFYLWCWDLEAERFWRHMARKYSLHAHKIGETFWGSPVLLFYPRSFSI